MLCECHRDQPQGQHVCSMVWNCELLARAEENVLYTSKGLYKLLQKVVLRKLDKVR